MSIERLEGSNKEEPDADLHFKTTPSRANLEALKGVMSYTRLEHNVNQIEWDRLRYQLCIQVIASGMTRMRLEG